MFFSRFRKDRSQGFGAGRRRPPLALEPLEDRALLTVLPLTLAAPPTSNVNALPAAERTSAFTVSWSGQDPGGPGIATYDIFVSDNGGAFAPFLTGTAQTSATFTGQDTHAYGFYSVATDSAGTRQPTPTQAQATTLVDLDAPTSTVAVLPADVNSTSFSVSWSGSDGASGSGITDFQVYVSDDGGAYTLWQDSATAGSANFAGQDGHTYGFYSVATDGAGNVQSTPTNSQSLTLVDTDPPKVTGAPTDPVATSPAYADTASFSVSWKGDDAPPPAGANLSNSGIADYKVYASDDGGAYTLWKDSTTAGSANFTGQDGHTYSFYTVATDKAGNVQATPAQAEASTLVDLTPPTSTVAALPALETSTNFTVSWGGSDGTNGSGIASYQIYYSDDGGTYALGTQTAAAGSAPLNGTPGHTYRFYAVATDKAGNVQPLPTAAQATTTLVQFTDAFNRANSATLGPNWAQVAGAAGVQGNQLVFGGSGTALAIYKSALLGDVAVQADVSLPATGKQYAGLVARYYGTGVNNFYLGEVVANSGKYTAYLFRNLFGTYKQLASAPVSDGAGTLRLEVFFNTLKLFLNGQLLTYAYDNILSTGATGVWGSPGAALDNFAGGLLNPSGEALPFSDSFTQADGSQLTRAWTEQAGNFSVQSDELRANAAGNNLALLNLRAQAADVGVQADIALPATGSQYVGLVARYGGSGVGDLYLGEVVANGGKYTAYLFRNLNGSFTKLAFAVIPGGTGTLRLEAVGSSLKLLLDGQQLLYAYDSALTSGFVGLWANQGATLDNFAAAAITAAPVTLPFSDSFTQADGSQLSPSWTDQVGNFSVKSNQVQANAAAGNLATVALSIADVAVQADIALAATGTQYAGLVARYGGPGLKDFYLGEVVAKAGKYTAYLFRNQGGTYTQLGQPVPLTSGAGTLLLQTAGQSIKLFFGGKLLTYAYDSALASGSAGLWAGAGVTLDNFAVAASTATAALPFTDSFSQPDGSQLSASWTEQEGNFSVQGGQLRANDPGVSLATVNAQLADVAVQANIALGTTGAQYAGLVARYSGPGEGGSMYLGEMVGNNGQFTAYIFRRGGGNWTQLAATPLGSGTGILRFTLKGSRLQLLLNNVVVCDVNDTVITGPGLAGLRATAGVLYGAFSVTAP